MSKEKTIKAGKNDYITDKVVTPKEKAVNTIVFIILHYKIYEISFK